MNVLKKMFNRTLNSQIIPNEWKFNILVPIAKTKTDRHDLNNYRGISLVNTLSKVFLKIITNRISNWLTENNVLIKEQLGLLRTRKHSAQQLV